MSPLNRLRYHVTGAIARGEKEAIVEQRAVMRGGVMNASDIKYRYQELNPNGHFFDRDTMKFFGDSMANFGVRKVGRDMYHLYRKRAVKHGLIGDGWIFDATSGRIGTPAAMMGVQS